MLLSSIEHVICDYFHISSEDIRKKTRKEKIRYPRQILFWMANYYLKRNELEIITQNNTLIQLVFISELGRYYSFNHSTILHAINVINNEIDYDKRLMPIINKLRMKIYLYDSEMGVKRLSERNEILAYLYEKRQIIMDLIEKYEHLPC